MYDDDPSFDCEKQLKQCKNAIKNYEKYINDFEESNDIYNSKMPHWFSIICCGIILALSGGFAFALSNIPLFAIAIISGVLGEYISLKKAKLIRTIKENNENIDLYKTYKNSLLEEKEYLELLTFNKTHKDVKIITSLKNKQIWNKESIKINQTMIIF